MLPLMLLLLLQGESLEATQTQGGPDSFVSGNLSRQQLADKEAKFRVRRAPRTSGLWTVNFT